MAGQLRVKGILAQAQAQGLGFLLGAFQEDSGIFVVEMEREMFTTICRGPAGFFEAHPRTLVLPPSMPDLCGLEVSDCEISSHNSR